MKNEDLKRLIALLKGCAFPIIGHAASAERLQLLAKDLEGVYLAGYSNMSKSCHGAWNWLIGQRFWGAHYEAQQYHITQNGLELLKESAQLTAEAASEGTSISSLFYGQRRCELRFADHDHAAKPGGITGRPLAEVAADVRSGRRSADAFPIQVFNYSGRWISINNRGFTMLNLAGVKPSRILPVMPSVDKLNRINDDPIVDDLDFNNLKWPTGYDDIKIRRARLAGNLPCEFIPVTAGSYGNKVLVYIAHTTMPSTDPVEMNIPLASLLYP